MRWWIRDIEWRPGGNGLIKKPGMMNFFQGQLQGSFEKLGENGVEEARNVFE